MLYPIVKYPEKVLDKVAAPVKKFDEQLAELAADMFESMYKAHGVGLAAPQIGVSMHLAVVDLSVGEDPAQRIVLCNPTILEMSGRQAMEEGCLSLPGFRAPCVRPPSRSINPSKAGRASFSSSVPRWASRRWASLAAPRESRSSRASK